MDLIEIKVVDGEDISETIKGRWTTFFFQKLQHCLWLTMDKLITVG